MKTLNTLFMLALMTLTSHSAFAQAGASENSVDMRPGTAAPDTMVNPANKPRMQVQNNGQAIDRMDSNMGRDAGASMNKPMPKRTHKTKRHMDEQNPRMTPSPSAE